MSLLSTDITKIKRLSVKNIKLSTSNIKPIEVKKPPSNEQIVYSKLVAINPKLEMLVECLDLVNETTGRRIKVIKNELPLSEV